MDETTRRDFTWTIAESGLFSIAGPAAIRDAAKLRVVRRKEWRPCYLALERSGELARRATRLNSIYRACRLCPRQCGVNRLKGETGICRSTARVKVASAHPHFGEEPPLVGRRGSGTIFFSNCNLRCEYCQNWEISHRGDGSYMSDEALGRLMAAMQDQGCHNINLVTPTHCVPNIVSALRTAIALGLRAPLVYNCGGYEPVEVLRLLDGVVDIYLPDFKYTDGAMAEKYSAGAGDYPEVAMAAIAEMHRQTGNLTTDEDGIALRGLMIRHLVLPNNIAGTEKLVRFVAEKLGPDTYVNLMSQYRPEHRARQYPELARRITGAEYRQAIDWARQAGLTNFQTQ
jgi:putative pyruvate formate lyase activating enzyme